MKYIVVLFFPFIFFSQNKELKNMVVGTSVSINEVWEVYPKNKIKTVNSENGNVSYMQAVIMSDFKKGAYTVMVVKASDNVAFIMGYAPGVEGENFNGKGEVYLYLVEGGVGKELAHIYQDAKVVSENNQFKECFENSIVKAVVTDKFEVDYFKIIGSGIVLFLPKGYFSYK